MKLRVFVLALCLLSCILSLDFSSRALAQSPINYGENVSSSISARGEIDTYFFSGTEGDFITIRMTANYYSGPQFELYDPDGTLLRRINGSNVYSLRSGTLRLNKSGAYTILVMDNGGTDTFEYGLFIQRLVNPVGSLPITYGENKAGSINAINKVITYSLNVVASDLITIRMTASYYDGPEFELYDPDGTLLRKVNGSNVYGVRLDSLRLSKSGTHTLLVMDNGGTNTFDYGLFVQKLVNPVVPLTINYGDNPTGSINSINKTVTYCFAGAADEFITVRMTASHYDGPQFELYDPDGTLLRRINGSNVYNIRSGTLRLNKSGAYTLLVMDNDGTSTFEYGLFVQRLVNPVGSLPIAYGENKAGSIDVRNKVITYSLNVVAGEPITIRMAASHYDGPEFELYDPDGILLRKVNGSNVYGVRLDSLRLGKSGAHTLLVMDNGGTSTFDYGLFSQRLINPVGSLAMNPGVTIQGNIASRGGVGTHTFTGATNGIITVLMTSSNSYGPQCEIYDPNGALVRKAVGSGTYSVRLDTVRLARSGQFTLLAMDDDGVNSIDYTVVLIRLSRFWAGFTDSSWHKTGNWYPAGIPSGIDSVSIGATSRNPVVYEPHSEVAVGALNLASAASLTVKETVPRFMINEIGTINGRIDLAQTDTLFIERASPTALQGSGKINNGTIQRRIQEAATGRYRFESDSTYVRYTDAPSTATLVRMTVFADTPPPDSVTWTPVSSRILVGQRTIQADGVTMSSARRWAIKIPRMIRGKISGTKDDGAILRYYETSVVGDTNATVSVSFRYDSSEVPAGLTESTLQLFTSGIVTDVRSETPAAIPTEFGLLQNYPNPFNPATTIRFTIAGVAALSGSEGPATNVRIAVYDMLGREVALLVNGRIEPGLHQVEFDGAALASGIYICRMTAGDHVACMKMLLLR
jgi:hypothetical protein